MSVLLLFEGNQLAVHRDGTIYRKDGNDYKLIKGLKDPNGYLQCYLTTNKLKWCEYHSNFYEWSSNYMMDRIVYKAFNQNWNIDNTNDHIGHIDGNKCNNNIDNLIISSADHA